MSATYYTPEIEEFCVGFEYETSLKSIVRSDSEWTKIMLLDSEFSDGTIDEIMFDLNCENGSHIRVKYLDRDDIEGEGWVFTGRSIDIWFKMPCDETPGGRNKLTHLVMHYNLQDHEMKITAFFGDTDEGCLFEGFILNLSEFRKLMKQLNIKKP